MFGINLHGFFKLLMVLISNEAYFASLRSWKFNKTLLHLYDCIQMFPFNPSCTTKMYCATLTALRGFTINTAQPQCHEQLCMYV